MHWTELPIEIFESILGYLDLNSVKALRLADCKFAQRCLGPRYLSCIQQPTLDVSLHTLHSLCALSRNPILSQRVHSLTFMATSLDSYELEKNVNKGWYIVRKSHGSGPMFTATSVEYSPEELVQAKCDLDWLREQQNMRAQESPTEMIEILHTALNGFSRLESINLDGALLMGRARRECPANGRWHPLWMRASHIFSFILTALVRSGLSLSRFNVYRQTPRCCIPSGHITTYASAFNLEQLRKLAKDLQSLQLSLSAEVKSIRDLQAEEGALSEDEDSDFGSSEGHLSHKDPRALLVDKTPGITSLLQFSSNLRKLVLSFRNALHGGILDSYDRIIESIAQETRFPRLEVCALSGFVAKGESILLFLQKHPDLRSLTLHQCTLTSGSWTPIFSYIHQSMSRLKTLSLSNLYGKHMQNHKYTLGGGFQDSNDREGEEDDEREGDGMVNLVPIWDNNPPPFWNRFITAGGTCVHTRDFTGEEIQEGLVFRPLRQARGRAKGSIEVTRWRKSTQAMYGAP
ncbi:hypothetical protein BDV25DRAFT_128696 [Aspergillus avenaceus]|uniref:F-box domain-containing protein n=1 Tax=Aspergillus avenaceus TaxID=36643 RepID=A0A5N6TYS3_ASPAV|nr:hypothetical protein BDV25DRAFT_128696 [Aspergillus avenaceus]